MTENKGKLRLANYLERKIAQKPYDDYIIIDVRVLWKIINILRN